MSKLAKIANINMLKDKYKINLKATVYSLENLGRTWMKFKKAWNGLIENDFELKFDFIQVMIITLLINFNLFHLTITFLLLLFEYDENCSLKLF